ncbi:MAG: hypothetical protein GTN99_02000, partial [Candidatus Dadabacteria bacterium]|nr:hypothetical protein [Candidatus Dadabacteria bacterium]
IYLEKSDRIEIDDKDIRVYYSSSSVFSDSIQKKDNLERIRDLVKKKCSKDFNVKVFVNNEEKSEPGAQE